VIEVRGGHLAPSRGVGPTWARSMPLDEWVDPFDLRDVEGAFAGFPAASNIARTTAGVRHQESGIAILR
jgi:hypothetical protein